MLVKLEALVLLTSGLMEIAFCVALTLVGERENPQLHVVFFVGFLLSCSAHFPLVTYRCSTHSRQLVLRLALIIALFGLIPAISTAFFLNLHYCVKNCEFSANRSTC